MTHRARLEAALKGRPVDRPPVSFWQHFPGRDDTAELLAAATVEFQQRFDLDLVKLMPTGMYSVMDYGVQVQRSDDDLGTTRYVSGPIGAPSDWAELPAASPDRGVLAQQVEVVRQVRAALDHDTPIIQTIFSPLTMAAKLVGHTIGQEILEHESSLQRALERLASDVVAFGRACLQSGADGFFFATQSASRESRSQELHERFGVPHDMAVLEALRPQSWCLMLHLHGADPLFDLANHYPIDAVSWEDRETQPSLAEARELTDRCLVGGVGRVHPLATGSAQEVAAQAREAITLMGGRRIVVAPGCVVGLSTPESNLRALRAAV